jgi:CspA family cold shock protein
MAMAGTVKFFNAERGYGFIKPDDGGRDVFVHITAVERAGLKALNEGQRVSFDVEPDKKGLVGRLIRTHGLATNCAPSHEHPQILRRFHVRVLQDEHKPILSILRARRALPPSPCMRGATSILNR